MLCVCYYGAPGLRLRRLESWGVSLGDTHHTLRLVAGAVDWLLQCRHPLCSCSAAISIADQGEGFLDSTDLAECHTIPWQCQPSGRQSSPWGQARSGHRRGCGGHQPFNSMEDTCLILKPSSRWSRWVQWKFTSPVPGTSTVTQYVPALLHNAHCFSGFLRNPPGK